MEPVEMFVKVVVVPADLVDKDKDWFWFCDCNCDEPWSNW